MVEKITWTKEAVSDYLSICDYLLANFSMKEVEHFNNLLQRKMSVLHNNPRLGSSTSKYPNVYKTVLHKKVILLYRFKPLKKEIVLLIFWNTLQNPAKNPFGING